MLCPHMTVPLCIHDEEGLQGWRNQLQAWQLLSLMDAYDATLLPLNKARGTRSRDREKQRPAMKAIENQLVSPPAGMASKRVSCE